MPINPTDDNKDSWRMFRIMGEFAMGFQTLSEIPRAMAIFGSARTKPDHPYYEAATEIAHRLAQRGFPILTGGGPGIMEAGNKGAYEADGTSVGLCIRLPFEQSHNRYITRPLDFNYFFTRKVMFIKHTAAIIVMPGGFGTMDEFFETMTLVQTHKIQRIPIILYGTEFWSGLLSWLKEIMDERFHYISPGDMDLFDLVDSPDEVMLLLKDMHPIHCVEDIP